MTTIGLGLSIGQVATRSTGVLTPPVGYRFLTEVVGGATYYLTETIGGVTYYLTEAM